MSVRYAQATIPADFILSSLNKCIFESNQTAPSKGCFDQKKQGVIDMIYPFITFNGDCREAVEFYAKIFGTEEPKFQIYSDFPQDPNSSTSVEEKNRIIYTKLKISDSIVMFADIPLGTKFVPEGNVRLAMIIKDISLVRACFDALKEDGIVLLPLQGTSYTKNFGILTDKYGITWQIGLGTEQDIENDTLNP